MERHLKNYTTEGDAEAAAIRIIEEMEPTDFDQLPFDFLKFLRAYLTCHPKFTEDEHNLHSMLICFIEDFLKKDLTGFDLRETIFQFYDRETMVKFMETVNVTLVSDSYSHMTDAQGSLNRILEFKGLVESED